MSIELSPLANDFLRATAELVRRQLELLPLAARAIGTTPFEYWIDPGDARSQHSSPHDEEWNFRFHGLELDIVHRHDSRFVRVDFAPGGLPAFTEWGVGLFIIGTRPPWQEFPDLRAHLESANGLPDTRSIHALCESLHAAGLIAHAAPALVALRDRYTVQNAGGQRIEVPPELLPPGAFDLMLCDRLVLTPAALDLHPDARAR